MKHNIRLCFKCAVISLQRMLKSLSNTLGLHREMLMPSFTMKRKLPINYKSEDNQYFEKEIIRECPGVFLVDAENVLLDVPKGVAISKFNVIEESLVSPKLKPAYGLSYVIRALCKPAKVIHEKPLLMVHNSYSEGYGHWMSDVIPRLFVIKDRIKDYKLILPASYSHNFFLKTLEPFGISKPEAIHYEVNEICWLDQLTIPSHVGPSFCNVKDDVLRQIRELYYDYYNVKPISKRRRIYVSRANTKKRFVRNESEVVALLKKFDFEVVHFQEHEFLEQLKIASETEIMIGLTGSGLNNMMFMTSESKVLELKMKDDYQNLHYFGFASGLELDYYYLICETIGEVRFSADFVVDIEALESIVIEMTSDLN